MMNSGKCSTLMHKQHAVYGPQHAYKTTRGYGITEMMAAKLPANKANGGGMKQTMFESN